MRSILLPPCGFSRCILEWPRHATRRQYNVSDPSGYTLDGSTSSPCRESVGDEACCPDSQFPAFRQSHHNQYLHPHYEGRLHSEIDWSLYLTSLLVCIDIKDTTTLEIREPSPRKTLRIHIVSILRVVECTSWATSTWESCETSECWSSCACTGSSSRCTDRSCYYWESECNE